MKLFVVILAGYDKEPELLAIYDNEEKAEKYKEYYEINQMDDYNWINIEEMKLNNNVNNFKIKL